MAGASFYMNAVTEPIIGNVLLPPRVFIGAEYKFNIPFPSMSDMTGHVLCRVCANAQTFF